MFSLISKIRQLPFTEVTDRKVLKKLKCRGTFTKILVDIFDDDLWGSKVSFFANVFLIFLIILSSVEVIWTSEKVASSTLHLTLRIIDVVSTIFFTIELALRLYVVGFYNDKYQGFLGRIRYLFSFYGFIDIAAILPFYIGLLVGVEYDFLKILRILRIWRIIRYARSIANLSNAIKSKGEEILVSLLAVFMLAVTVSTLIYYAEEKSGANEFSSILNVLVWSLAKYTGDYAGLAEYKPVTLLGQVLATFNGLLGIAIFAVPAGLLGSAFIDELTEQKKKKENSDMAAAIANTFVRVGSSKVRKSTQLIAHQRYRAFDAIVSRNFLTEEQIITAVSASQGHLIIRAMKSSPDVLFNDIKILEYFPVVNRSYGACVVNPNRRIFIIDGVGGTERGIAHFNYTLADNLGYNYIARLKRLFLPDGEQLPSNYHKRYYGEVEKLSPNEVPYEHIEFFEDIQDEIKPNDWVFLIISGASGREDVIVEYGKAKGTTQHNFEKSTIQDTEKFLVWENHLKNLLTNGITIQQTNAASNTFTFSYGLHSVGNLDQAWIGRTIHRLTKANVVTVYVNINILIGEDNPYFALLKIFATAFEQTFGNFKKNEI